MLKVLMLMRKGQLPTGQRFLKASSITQMERNRIKEGDKAPWLKFSRSTLGRFEEATGVPGIATNRAFLLRTKPEATAAR